MVAPALVRLAAFIFFADDGDSDLWLRSLLTPSSSILCAERWCARVDVMV